MKIKNSASALSRSMRIGIATITSTALLGGVLVAVPAHPLLSMTAIANAQDTSAPFATATGQVIDLKLLEDSIDPADSAAFLVLLEAIRAEAQFPGDTADSANIDLTLLQGIDVVVSGVKIPLTDILSIEGTAGALGANASTPAGNKAAGAAGVVNEDGSIDLGAHQDGSAVDTTLDLANILGSADVISEDIISDLSLRIGAVSASASRTGDQVTSEYALSNVDLQVKSPLVADLTEFLVGPEDGLGVSIDTAVGQVAGNDGLLDTLSGVLGGVFGLLSGVTLGLVDIEEPTLALDSNIQETLQPIVGGTLQGDAVSIDLNTGSVNVNLEKLGGTSAVDPNTDLLTAEAVQKIEDEIQDLLNQLLTEVRAAIDEGLLETHVELGLGAKLLGIDLAQIDIEGTLNEILDGDTTTVNVVAFDRDASPVTNAVVGLLGNVGSVIEGALDEVVAPLINNTLDQGVSGIIAPLVQWLTDVLGDARILRITLNDQPNPQVGAVNTNPARPNSKTGAIATPADAFTVSALRVNVLDGLIDLPLSRVTVDADKNWAPVVAPTIAPIADQTIVIGSDIANVTPVVTPAGATVTVTGLPAGVSFAGGVISGTPTAVGSSTVTVTATNSGGTVNETFVINVLPKDVEALTIAPIPDQTITLGSNIANVTPVFTPAGATVTVTGLPAGVSFAGGVISGTPTATGVSNVTVTATLGTASVSTTFKITVEDVEGEGPDVEPIDDQIITIGDPIDDVIPVVTPEDAEVSVVGLPAGVTYEDGEISGTPTQVGEYEVTVTAANEDGTDSETFTIIVEEVGGNSNGSSDFLQQCLNSPAAPIAALLIALGAISQVAGPALGPVTQSINAEIERQTRNFINTAGIQQPGQPEWLANINRQLANAANSVDPNFASKAFYAAGALALISIPVLCGMSGSSSSSS